VNIDKWNNQVLKSKGINAVAQNIKVVRSIGDVQELTLWDGVTKVHRQDYIFVEGYGLVKCCPYELYFIFQTPDKMKGWSLYCGCGSIAGVVGMRAYSKLAFPTDTGHMIVCIRHQATKNNVGIGSHADGSTE
jgi:hypothetical protein